uniref:Uncharacterized protein n=1 Tax=Ciona intestinalis TaxID=7719 RepID=H2XSL8_CIOIN
MNAKVFILLVFLLINSVSARPLLDVMLDGRGMEDVAPGAPDVQDRWEPSQNLIEDRRRSGDHHE